MFSKQLIDYTEQTFREETIDIRTKTMVKNVEEKYIDAEYSDAQGNKVVEKIPYGLLVWATGNALRPVVKDLMSQIPAQAKAKRGLEVNEYLVVKGTEDIWAVGDCASECSLITVTLTGDVLNEFSKSRPTHLQHK